MLGHQEPCAQEGGDLRSTFWRAAVSSEAWPRGVKAREGRGLRDQKPVALPTAQDAGGAAACVALSPVVNARPRG